MTTKHDLTQIAKEYHEALPDRIRTYLNTRGIPDATIDLHLLGWNGSRITIPITNRDGNITHFKLAKDPEDQGSGAKMLATPGSRLELYGWEVTLSKPERIIICEGEFDRLVLASQGFPAVTSTGGPRNFLKTWAPDFDGIREIYLCFDRDIEGQEGALKVGQLLPQAKLVELPDEVGEGGDVTDFFVRLQHSRDDFERLLAEAIPVPEQPAAPAEEQAAGFDIDSGLRRRIARIKHGIPIADLVRRYVELQGDEELLTGRCPFHEDAGTSLAVYPRSRSFYCFGCGKRGDVITFIRQFETLNFPEALDRLESFLPDHDGGKPATGQ